MSQHNILHDLEREVEAGLAQEGAVYTSTPPTEQAMEDADNASVPVLREHDGSTATTAAASRDPTIKASPSPPTHPKALSDSEPVDPLALGKAESQAASNEAQPGQRQEDDSGILTGLRLFLVFLALMLSVFMFALDQSIVSTAIPVIVSDFNAFDQVSWIITGYFLTQVGLILLAGQLLTVLKAKWVLLSAIFFFELGSLLCAVAQNMNVLIFARAVQGIGASGMFVSILAIITIITKLEQRPAFMAAFGIVFVISSVVGPLLGGVFTQHVSWRWCFWINLPFGGFAAAAVVFLLPAREPRHEAGDDSEKISRWRAVARMDWIGSALVMVLITCLLLALQWGGNDYAWSNWRIILLFTLGGVLVPVFGLWQWYLDKRALIPLSLLKNRTQLACAGAMFFFMMGMLGGTYQLPLYYQAGRAHSPTQSGIDVIPFMLSICVAIFISGGLTTAFGRYYPFFVIGPPISAIGFGLLYTITAETSNSKLIGYQILAGFGIGLSFQNALIAIQAEYHERPHLIPQATGVVSFFQLAGAAIGIGIVNTVQSVFLSKEIKELAPNVDFELVRQSVSAIFTLPVDEQGPVIEAYIIAITESLIPIIAAMGLAWIIAMCIKNHNMKEKGAAHGAMA